MKCENAQCDKPLGKYAKRFCSKSCSNAVVKRLASTDSRKKMTETLRKTKSDARGDTSRACIACGLVFDYQSKKRKTCSDECFAKVRVEVSKKATEASLHSDNRKGWLPRTGRTSRAEALFEQLLADNGVTGWEREHRVGRWYIDFAFIDKMIAVELDGKHHAYADRAQSDAVKDAHLASVGWKVFRVKLGKKDSFDGVSEQLLSILPHLK